MKDFVRSIKVLIAINNGAQIIQYKWINKIIDQMKYISHEKYFFNFDKQFDNYHFNLQSSL